jgi:hypothetical protein
MAGVTTMRVRVLEIKDEKQITEKFSKREMIGRIEGEYPQDFLFEFPNDKGALLDTVLPDTYVTVSYNLRSNRVASKVEGEDDRFYLSLSAWKVEA